MTGLRNIFLSLDESVKMHVRLGDDKQVQVEGKGTIGVGTKSGKVKHIINVLYIPGLAHNLISIGQLIQRGYSVMFHNDVCEIRNLKSEYAKLKVKMTETRMFPLEFSSLEESALVVKGENESFLWHLRYGHLHFIGLKLLSKKQMVVGLPSINHTGVICEGYVYGKQQRASFPVGKSWRAKVPLGLIHADLCGKMQTESLSRSKYFLLFVDDFSRMSWVYFLREKSEAFSMFQIFKAQFEKQSGCFIKTLRTDQGGEFVSNEFNSFCEEHGICRQLITSNTPQQNGVAKRKNKTVVETARSMLKAKKASKFSMG
eukprot:TRINITY_DN4845_c0_g1_i1.p1 TRINITY_DN4845_c0_g1~~TRINITY_DN4845_c0_g1_i1.p1  ORF type:complete len:315 (+),score=41.54 TRINITY_DN4845_c0_g1_i1:771-1715(+)